MCRFVLRLIEYLLAQKHHNALFWGKCHCWSLSTLSPKSKKCRNTNISARRAARFSWKEFTKVSPKTNTKEGLSNRFVEEFHLLSRQSALFSKPKESRDLRVAEGFEMFCLNLYTMTYVDPT